MREAARRGIPTAVHESNAEPGLTTKALAKVVDKVMVGFEESRSHYPHPERVEVTGTPVRGDFFQLTRQEARAALDYDDSLPVVLTTWGSLGAQVMWTLSSASAGRASPSTTSTASASATTHA